MNIIIKKKNWRTSQSLILPGIVHTQTRSEGILAFLFRIYSPAICFVRVHHKRKSPRDLPKSLGDSYYLFNNQRLLNCCCNPLIYKAANTEEENSCHANSQCKLSVTVTLEGWQWIVCTNNIHSLYNLKIVVE